MYLRLRSLEEIVEASDFGRDLFIPVPQERVPERIAEQIVDVPTPQISEEIFSVPQERISERIAERCTYASSEEIVSVLQERIGTYC